MSRAKHIINRTAILLLLLAQWVGLNAQEVDRVNVAENAEYLYGPEIELVQGEKYFYPYNLVKGDPFFEYISTGETVLWIEGKPYKGYSLKYDVYTQLLVLEYKDKDRTPVSIVLGNERIDRFNMGGKEFRKFRLDEDGEKFGQVAYEGEMTCLFFWYKVMDYEMVGGEKIEAFSPQRCKRCILKNGEFHSFRNKRSFLRILSEEQRMVIKPVIRQYRIRMRKVSDGTMHLLMTTLEDKE